MGAQGRQVTALVRVLLTVEMPDGAQARGTDIATVTGYPGDVDGYTSWSDLVELRPGVDVAALPRTATSGLDRDTALRIGNALDATATPRWRWSPNTSWNDDTQRAEIAAGDPPILLTLTDLLASWGRGGAAGRAECGDRVIEAPSYVDSILITGNDELLDRLVRAGLEAHAVSRARRIPIWRD